MSAQVKAMLRRESRRRRNAIPERDARSAAICERVATLPAYRSARVLHSYLPIRSEVDTRPLLLTALARGTGVVVPVVRPDVNELTHSWVASLAAEDLEVGTFGTLQPRLLQPAEVGVWDLVIVPLLAFDRAGYRLGYGKGFYDRLLTSAPATTVGLAFAAQEAPRIPHEPHDMPLDLIVTEDEVIAAGAGREG